MSIEAINRNGRDGFTVDIEIYANHGEGYWAKKRYLVHGLDDSMWTSTISEAIAYLKYELERLENRDAITSR